MATLPVLPLTDAVLLPGMVVPVTLDATTQAAVDAARAAGDNDACSPCPASTASTARSAPSRDREGRPAAQRRAGRRGPRRCPGPHRLRRARSRRGAVGRGDRARRARRPPARRASWPASTRRWSPSMLQQRGAWQVIDAVERMTDLSELADSAGYAPWLTLEQKVELLGAPDVDRAAGAAGRLGPRAPRRAGGHRADQQRRPRGAGEVAARVPAAPAARRDPQGARRGRAGRLGRLPRPGRGRRPAREGPRGRAARGRQAGAGQRRRRRRPAGSAPGSTPCWRCRGHVRTEDNTDLAAARAVLDADHAGLDRREGPHPRVPGRAQPPRRPQPAGGRRPRLRRGAGAGRPARRRQDQPRRVGRAGARPQVRPGVARRRPRRGGDPRPPAHLRRRAARPHRPGAARGRLDEPGRAARRGRQARRRLRRRPGRGPARGARPGAEPHVPRPLPRGRPRPVRRAVPGHRERGRDHPRPAAGPDGAGHARRLHRGGEGRHRPRPPAAAAARPRRPDRRRGEHRRRGARPRSPPSTPARRACGSWSGRSPRSCARSRSRWPTDDAIRYGVDASDLSTTWAGRGSRRSRPSAPRCPAWPPAWR